MPKENIAQADKPASTSSTVLNMTPVVLTVLATVFAGVSSSEMTQSMFYRALAAQEQSKSGDEWAFFQTKRIRGTSLETTGQLLDSFTHPVAFSADLFHTATTQMISALDKTPGSGSAAKEIVLNAQKQFDNLLANDSNKRAFQLLTSEKLPVTKNEELSNKEALGRMNVLIKDLAERKTENATANNVRQIQTSDIDDATAIAEHNAEVFEKACQPVNQEIEDIRKIMLRIKEAVTPYRQLTCSTAAGQPPVIQLYNDLEDSLKLCAMHFDALRYKQEASYNRRIAELIEVHVRRSGVESDRHRDRSRNFFYSMLVAQAGVTIASLALSKQRRSELWMLAAVAGVAAIAFFSYVYFSL
jgi:hypothetical protein